MHIYFSGIGGTGIGPLALIAKEAGFQVSGSDKQNSAYIDYLQKKGIVDIHIGQSRKAIAEVHERTPIDWLVYSSSLTLENEVPSELEYCHQQRIKSSKRDEFINYFLNNNDLKLIAVAGTHGKTTTTAMIIWLFKQLDIPLSYSVGAKLNFGDMGQYQEDSKYFVYECDEFDRNFLAYEPYISVITGVSWDHHEIFPTREEYQQAFKDFVSQSRRTMLWEEDFDYLELHDNPENLLVQSSDNPLIDLLRLEGRFNRLDGWLAIQAVRNLTKKPIGPLVKHINKFPGLQRRMEQIVPGLYSDYAHTPEKIRGAMHTASEIVKNTKKRGIVVLYEPLTNRRQHYIIEDYKDCFNGAKHIYWLPSYLAREDPNQRIIAPEELIAKLSDPKIASAMKIGSSLKETITKHLNEDYIVVAMSGGGGSSLDEWLREEFKETS